MRKSKRGDGETKEPATATLVFPDEKMPVTKMKEVTDAVTNIIGLDKNQFTQIAMIAQGDFLKLLLAKTDDRQKIFRQIFNTMPYKILQDKLKEESKKKHDIYEDKNKSISQYISGVQIDADSPLCVKWESVVNNRTDAGIEEILSAMGEIIAEDRNVIKRNKKDISTLDRKISDIDIKIGQNETVQRALKEKNKALEILHKCESEIDELAGELKAQQGLSKEREKLQFDIQSLTEKISEYDKLEQADRDINKVKDELELVEKQRFLVLKNNIEKYIDNKKELIKIQEEYSKANVKLISIRDSYIDMEQNFMNQQAGILASNLAPGQPCPVCGSIEHPSMAEMPKDAPSKEQLDCEKERVELYQKKTLRLSEKAHDKKAEVQVKEKEVTIYIEDVLGNVKKDSEDIISTALEYLKSELRCHYIPSNNEYTETEYMSDTVKKVIEDCRLKINELSTVKSQLQNTLQFESKELAQKHIADMKHRYNRLEKNLKKAEEDYNACKNRMEAANNTINTIDKQLKNIEIFVIHDLKEQRNELISERNKLNKISESAGYRVNTNALAKSEIEKQYNELKTVEEEWNIIKSLSNTANGNVSGKEKILLETYVQMNYFDAILKRANIRLMTMSSGQYELKRSDSAENLRDRSGLDLSVTDHYNGSTRSVKTLSGGEAFKASLSLAMGLSDEIHSRMGGIKIDTLFVDEGFGSLDEESLSQAMDALSNVTEGNRLVGIISHVNELKDRIDRKIYVEKDRVKGSKVRIEI
jgi:exonuclease SbcC